MKKIRSSFILLLSLCLVFSAAVPAHAKDLEVCYHCSGSGEYHCSVCGNSGQVICDQCGGKGTQACPGEDGKGACSSGWYTCPSCHGDTYLRNGDGQIPQDAAPGSCSTCSGKGKLECIVCHGSGRKTCNRCGGSGKQECQVLDCRAARSAGGKCSYCMGAGYLLTNNEPGKNDGVQNKPENGDLIWANGKSTTYGGGSSGGSGNSGSNTNSDGNSNQGGSGGGGSGNSGGSGGSNNTRYDNNGSSIPRDPSSGRDFIWYLDTGSGKWEFGDVLISIERGGKAASGTLDLKFNEDITIKSSTGDLGKIHAYITGSEGFKAELERNGDGDISVARHMPEGQYVPFKLSLMIEYEQDDPANDPVEPGPEVDTPEPGPGEDPVEPDPVEDPADIPDERPKYPVDFGSGSWIIDGAEKPVRALIDGHAASGVVEVEEYTAIKLADFDGGFMQVRIYSDDGFSAALETNGDNEVSIGRTSSGDIVAPDTALHFEIIKTAGEEPEPEEKRYSLLISSYLVNVYYDPAVKNSARLYSALRLELNISDTIYLNAQVRDPNAATIWSGYLAPRNASIYSVSESSDIQLSSCGRNNTTFFNKYCKVFVLTSDRRYVELIPDENGYVKLSRRTPSDAALTEELTLCFELIPVKGITWYSPSLSDVPPIQSHDNIIIDSIDNGSPISSFDIRAAYMTEGEQAAYLALGDEEKNNIAETLETVVRSVRVASMNDALKRKLRKIAKENGFDKVRNANNVLLIDNAQFIPIQFDGHIELDFPVVVEIAVDPEFVQTDKTVFLYHINYKGEVEFLEHGIKKDENGNVIAITFHTRSFSDFFLSNTKLTKGLGEEDLDYFYEHLGIKKPFPTTAVIIAAAAVAVVAAAVAAVIILSRRKKITEPS